MRGRKRQKADVKDLNLGNLVVRSLMTGLSSVIFLMEDLSLKQLYRTFQIKKIIQWRYRAK